uniref:Uncharacterized protein n=1 Tax=Manihot esculenta TaxID=3983 RepID=A0A2C9VFU2_MANES
MPTLLVDLPFVRNWDSCLCCRVPHLLHLAEEEKFKIIPCFQTSSLYKINDVSYCNAE